MNERDDDLINAINAAEETSYGGLQNSQLSQERSDAINMYLGKNVDPAPEGRSQVISRDVYDTIAWIKPSLLRIFTGTEQVVKVDPLGPDDEDAAAQETSYLNYLILNKNPWEQICRDWFTDALLTKNAYCMAYWDTCNRVEKETYERQSEDSLALLLQDNNVTVIAHKAYPDPDSPPVPILDPATQMPVMDQSGKALLQPQQLHDVTIKRVTPSGKLSFMVLPPERTKISESTPDFQLLHCDYFEYWEHKTLSYIRSMGFDIDDDVADDSNENELSLVEDQARNQFFENTASEEGVRLDPSMRKIKLRMVWIRYDYDGDGIAELQYCLIVGRRVLYREEISSIPVASIVPDPLPHRHIGLSIYDLVYDIQEIKTAIFRQGLDNLYLSNNQRMFVTDKINLDDFLVSLPGSVVRGERGALFGQDIAPLPTQFVFPEVMQGMQYLDSIRQNRTGTNEYFTGVDQNALNKTAHGISQLTSSASQRVEEIARIFSVGMKTLFAIAHEIVLKHGRKADTVKLNGQWVTVDPSAWKKRTDFSLSVGIGAGNREQMMQNLMMILAQQAQAFPLGVSTAQNVYNTLVELVKAAGFHAADKFFTDPVKNPKPQTPPPEFLLEQQKLQNDAQHKAGQLALEHERLHFNVARAVAKDHLDRHSADRGFASQAMQNDATLRGLQLDHQIKHRQTAVQEKESDSQTNKDALETTVLAGVEEKLTTSFEQLIRLNAGLENAAKALADAAARMAGPKQVVRDKDGKITGIKPA